jgi:hypothetical protein
MAPENKPSGIGVVWTYFKAAYLATGGNLTSFKNDWTALSSKDKEDIRSGIDNGSLTY